VSTKRHVRTCETSIGTGQGRLLGGAGIISEANLGRDGACVQQLLYHGFVSVGFRPTEEDLRVIEANRRADEKTSDVIRRALRLLDREAWEERARADMHRLRGEDLSAEPDAWKYAADGSIQIVGSSLTVPARTADQG
jgi:hypothetical protein